MSLSIGLKTFSEFPPRLEINQEIMNEPIFLPDVEHEVYESPKMNPGKINELYSREKKKIENGNWLLKSKVTGNYINLSTQNKIINVLPNIQPQYTTTLKTESLHNVDGPNNKNGGKYFEDRRYSKISSDQFTLIQPHIRSNFNCDDSLKYLLNFFNARILAFAKQRLAHDCKQVIEDIRRAGLIPDVYSYTPIIKLLMKQCKPKEVSALVSEMHNAGVMLHETTYNALIQFCVREGYIRMGGVILKKMQEEGLNPNIMTYVNFMEFYITKGDIGGVEIVWKEMILNDVKPNIKAYTNLIKFYVKIADLEKVEAVWNDMKRSGITPNMLTYTSLMQFYVNNGDLRAVEEIWKGMKQDEMMLPYDKNAEFIEAEVFLQEVKQSKLITDEVRFNILMLLYERNGDLKGARALLDNMRQSGIRPGEVIYKMFINLLVDLNCLDEAKYVFDSNFSRNKYTCNFREFNICDLSYGAAFIALSIFIESFWDRQPFKVIVGKGRDSIYMMENYLKKKINTQFVNLDCHIDSGMMTISAVEH
ncbi:MAG: hypothetical protein H0U27_04145 [Nitrosopumilus sp.]|nr:hypothetical protein [Nitrosopumilus sp.]